MTDKQIIIYKKECYNEPLCSLNQLLEHLNAYKMEAEEGKEINAELKAENDELKKRVAELSLFQLYKIQRDEAEQTLIEIKEIAEKGHKERGNLMRTWWFKEILQKISECEGNDD